MNTTLHPDAVTEFVADAAFTAYRRNAKRLGLVIVMSSPVPGGYYVTTAARRERIAR